MEGRTRSLCGLLEVVEAEREREKGSALLASVFDADEMVKRSQAQRSRVFFFLLTFITRKLKQTRQVEALVHYNCLVRLSRCFGVGSGRVSRLTEEAVVLRRDSRAVEFVILWCLVPPSVPLLEVPCEL